MVMRSPCAGAALDPKCAEKAGFGEFFGARFRKRESEKCTPSSIVRNSFSGNRKWTLVCRTSIQTTFVQVQCSTEVPFTFSEREDRFIVLYPGSETTRNVDE